MPFVHENVKVELFPGTPSPIVHLSENDVGDTLAFELIYKGQPVNVPNGSVVKFKGTKKDGLGFTVDSSNVSGNVVSFVVSEDMTSCSGVVESEISITLSNNKHGTCNVVLIVEKNPHSDGTQDGSYPQIVSEMRALVNQIEGDAATASNAADTAVAAKNSALEIQQDVHQYTASAIDDWLDNHPEATTTVQDGSLTLNKVKYVVNPDNFTGTDSEKLASAINSLPNGGTVLLDRDYTLTDNVIITRNSNVGKVIVKPINGNSHIACGSYEFTGEGVSDGRVGGVCFEGIRFSGTGNLIDGYHLIRMFFRNCYIENFNTLVYSSGSYANNTRYLQTIYFESCVIRGITGYIIYLPYDVINNKHAILYDVRINKCVIEWSHGVICAGNWQGVFVEGNAIEGFTGDAPLFYGIAVSACSVIKSNYFEKNINTTIDLSKYENGNFFNFDISNNVFIESTKDSGSVIALPVINPSKGTVNISNNTVTFSVGSGAYGIAVSDNTVSNLTNVNITGSDATVYDPNNRLANTSALNKLYVSKLYKVDYVISQVAGESKNLQIPITLSAINGTTARVPVAFPFVADNVNYTVDILNLNVTNIGTVTENASVQSKLLGGVIVAVVGTFTIGRSYDGTILIKVTFT